MENITEAQKQLIEILKKNDVTIRWNEERGVASVLKGKLMEWKSGETPQELLYRWLRAFGQLIGSNAECNNIEYVGTTEIRGEAIQIRAMQKAEGLPIYGATLLLFTDKKQGIYRVQSGLYRDPKVPPARVGTREVDFKAMGESLAKRLRKRLEANPKGSEFESAYKKRIDLKSNEWAIANFPIVDPPKLWLYPTQQGLRQAFIVYAYQPITWWGVSGEKRETIDLATLVIDAKTGRIISEGGRLGMSYTDTNGQGLSTLVNPDNTYLLLPLLTVRDANTNYYRLINRSHTPNIITYDAGGRDTTPWIFQNDTDISLDADNYWDRATNSCLFTNREQSQQPETDAHFLAEQAYTVYQNIGWRGFDNGGWGTYCPVYAVVHIGLDANAYFWRYISNGKHYGYIAFYDGKCSGNDISYDFMAGDPVIFAHEYQHGITYFGVRTPLGDPGYLEPNGWHRAIHEGLSDSMAGLRTEIWVTPAPWPKGSARGGKPFRRIEYPRSTDTMYGTGFLDHFDDRNTTTNPYAWSTILSHAAFLAGQGGVHQRTSRSAELIPVVSYTGTGIIALILHRAITEHFGNFPANSANGNAMIEAANHILEAAEEITGTKRSWAYVTLRRAFYAVGLYPYDGNYNKITYGGEACMLPWTIAWSHSREYLGFPELWWQSPDLFINNGNGPEYDVKIGYNKLFARVRNIGDLSINNVAVKFYFIACGTNLPPSSTQWKECKDQNGNVCILNIPTLAAGSMNFTDENNPPANQAVNWYLDPTEIVQGLDHFCIRADISCNAANNDNDCPNSVQSNISYTPIKVGELLDLHFIVANWDIGPNPIEMEIKHTLPKAFKIEYAGEIPLKEIRLKPKEQLPLHWQIKVPKNLAHLIGPPYEGKITAEVRGATLQGTLIGELDNIQVLKRLQMPIPLSGRIAGSIEKKMHIIGTFNGKFDPANRKITGTLNGTIYTGKRTQPNVKLRLKGSLEPLRAINFIQKINGKIVGGITIKLKLPEGRAQLTSKTEN